MKDPRKKILANLNTRNLIPIQKIQTVEKNDLFVMATKFTGYLSTKRKILTGFYS